VIPVTPYLPKSVAQPSTIVNEPWSQPARWPAGLLRAESDEPLPPRQHGDSRPLDLRWIIPVSATVLWRVTFPCAGQGKLFLHAQGFPRNAQAPPQTQLTLAVGRVAGAAITFAPQPSTISPYANNTSAILFMPSSISGKSHRAGPGLLSENPPAPCAS
jgi:hypothetical protein